MDLIETISLLRRRWVVVAATAVVGALVALITGATLISAQQGGARYRADTLLLSNGRAGSIGSIDNLATLSVLVSTETVRAGAAASLGVQDGGHIPGTVATAIDPSADILTVSATSARPADAAAVSRAYADSLIAYLRRYLTDGGQQEITRLQQRIASLGGSPGAQAEATVLRERVAQLRERSAEPTGVTLIETTAPVPAGPGLLTPRSDLKRGVLGFLLGALAGVGIALVVERFDARVRDPGEVSLLFDAPVLGDIPLLPSASREVVVTAAEPLTPPADAYRLLAASVAITVHQRGERDDRQRPAVTTADAIATPPAPGVILVTSAGADEGKSTVVANLAAAYAQQGHRVVAASLDLRRPTLHGFFGREAAPGIAELLLADREASRPDAIERVFRSSGLAGVELLSSGVLAKKQTPIDIVNAPGMERVLEAARARADVVLLDTAPILFASETAALLPFASVVLVAVWSGKVGYQVATRSAAVLRRLTDAPAGLVMIGGESSRRGYYDYRYAYSSAGPADASAERSSGAADG